MARREEYGAELPAGVLLLTMGVDTQDDRLEYEVVGHGHFGETWGIRKGVILGRPDTDAVWSELDAELERIYHFENGVGLRVSIAFVDEGGHFTQDVRQRCLARQGRRVFAIKGRGGSDIPYTSPPKPQKIVMGGKTVGKCYVFSVGVDAGKQLIMDSLRVKEPSSPKYCHFPRRDDYGAAYFRSLLSEHLVYKENSKTNRWQWEKIPGHERNEALDCRNYALAAAKAMSPNYDALERRIKGTQSTETQSAHQPPKEKKKPDRRSGPDKYYDDW